MHDFQPQAALSYEYVDEVIPLGENLEGGYVFAIELLKITNVKFYHSIKQTFLISVPTVLMHKLHKAHGLGLNL